MREYKYDTHVHTSEASACATGSGAEIARRYRQIGYDGILITDHFFGGNTAVPSEPGWEEKIDLFCKGYENAKREGEKIGLSVFFGFEAAYSGTEFLVFGIDKAWLTAHPDMQRWDVNEFLARVRGAGGFVSHAHPFRERVYIKRIMLIPDLVDAAEVYNTGNQNPLFDDRADWYADSYGLYKTAGTDTHATGAKTFGGMVFSRKIADIDDFISAVKNGETRRLIKGETHQ